LDALEHSQLQFRSGYRAPEAYTGGATLPCLVGRRLLLGLAVVFVLATPGQARAAIALSPCPQTTDGVQCGTVDVPLDRSGAGAWATISGPGRRFYATRDHAEDLESVRVALGAGRIGLFGVSYGTKLALAYALAHPDAVERIVLDSVVAPAYPDPFERNVLR